MINEASQPWTLGQAWGLGIVEGLELLDRPCVVLTEQRRVVALNASAQQILGDGVMAGCNLGFADRASQDRFEAVLRALLHASAGSAARPVALVQTHAGQHLTTHLVDLRGVTRQPFVQARVLLLLEPPESRPARTDPPWRSLYGLTQGEMKLAAELCAGLSLSDTATRLGIAYETARSRLKKIFAKTGTRRQAQLVALLST